jgi:regulator of nucleoside diphosphate kinase
MEQIPALIILQEDFYKISAVLSIAKPEIVDLLEEEFARARLVAKDQLPEDIVTMNSIVTFVDLDSKKEQKMKLVYPHDADAGEGRISILAPVGAALIGLRAGQTIDWPMPNKTTKHLLVTDVQQPTDDERA